MDSLEAGVACRIEGEEGARDIGGWDCFMTVVSSLTDYLGGSRKVLGWIFGRVGMEVLEVKGEGFVDGYAEQ